jgi:hypothetical protein
MARRRAGDRGIAMSLGRRTPVVSELMPDSNIVCAQIDAKLFGRLRLLSLDARVVVGKPTTTAPVASRATPARSRRTATLDRDVNSQGSAPSLGRAVELWTLSSEVLEGIRAR